MTATKNILITDRWDTESLMYLKQYSFLNIERVENPLHLPMDKLAAAHGLLIRSRTQVNRELLSRAQNLQVVVTATSGFDHFDFAATKQWGITVMYTPTGNVESAAELTWALVMGCARRVMTAHKMVKAGEWLRDSLMGLEIHGRTYGIVGLGRIGSRVAQIAQAFNMKVVAYDPYIEQEAFDKVNAKRVSYEELLKMSDIVSFHVPKTKETEKMLGASQLEYCNRGMILVNTSRGSVIDEEALIKALENQWVAAAGLDVFEKEPLPRTSPLLHIPNVILTPHLGSVTDEAFHQTSLLASQKIVRFFTDGSTSDTLPPKVPWF